MNDACRSLELYMKMIEHYLDSLETYLPDEMKQDVRDELKASLIGQVEDSQEFLGRDLNIEEMESLLRKLGHPMQVASSYLPKQQLIGQDIYPAYRKAMEIALLLMTVVTLLFSAIGALSGGPLIGTTIQILANLVHNGLYVFAIVTLIFYLMEYYEADLNKIYAWSPRDLKSSHKRLRLSRLETGFEVGAYILFLAFWNNIVALPSQSFSGVDTANISLSREWQSVFWSVNVVMSLCIALGIHKFVIATQDRFSLIGEIVLSLATLAILALILQFDQFVTLHSPPDGNIELMRFFAHMDNVVYSILTITAGFCLWDVFSNFRKISNKID